MPENRSQPRRNSYSIPAEAPQGHSVRQPTLAPEARSFGADDIEGIRLRAGDRVGRVPDRGGEQTIGADLPPAAASRARAAERGAGPLAKTQPL